MTLSTAQRQYLLVAQGLIPFAINFVLNGLLGLALFRGIDPVAVWGRQSSAGPDLIGTCFFLPAITCLIVTPLAHRQIRGGKDPGTPVAIIREGTWATQEQWLTQLDDAAALIAREGITPPAIVVVGEVAALGQFG